MADTVQSADGTTIAYEHTGSGTPLIVIGGALNTRQSAAALVPLLSADFSVVSYDRRGRGESTDTAPYAVEREIEDLAALVAAVGTPAVVYGHSSGAILALEAGAAGIPVSKIVAYEPPYLTRPDAGESWELFAEKVQSLVDQGDQGKAVEEFIRHTGGDFDEGIKQAPWWPALTALAHTLPHDLALTGDSMVPAERLLRISVPTLALYGGASPAWAEASAAAVAAAVQNGRKEVIEGQNHMVANELLAPVLRDFFSNRRAAD
ncbi:alpha/beta fold hydrolase [Pseudarthrobacter sp. N5]|uniref:alpha/beta fold hydrolase n=1 Tax=Pseudarthrobacter sp. N5 TaxID=3418416 RepID=UPI003CEC1E93